MTAKLDLMAVINRGNTPCVDVITQTYPKGCDLILGKIVRYSMMDSGKCVASRERLCKELKIDAKTFDKRMKFLEAQGLVIDETPELRNHPHTYSVNLERLNEEIDLFEESKGEQAPTVEIFSTEEETNPLGNSSTVEILPTAREILPTDWGNPPYEDSIESKIEFNIDSKEQKTFQTSEEEHLPSSESKDITYSLKDNSSLGANLNLDTYSKLETLDKDSFEYKFGLLKYYKEVKLSWGMYVDDIYSLMKEFPARKDEISLFDKNWANEFA